MESPCNSTNQYSRIQRNACSVIHLYQVRVAVQLRVQFDHIEKIQNIRYTDKCMCIEWISITYIQRNACSGIYLYQAGVAVQLWVQFDRIEKYNICDIQTKGCMCVGCITIRCVSFRCHCTISEHIQKDTKRVCRRATQDGKKMGNLRSGRSLWVRCSLWSVWDMSAKWGGPWIVRYPRMMCMTKVLCVMVQ